MFKRPASTTPGVCRFPLLKPENRGKLVAVITYHVVPGRPSVKEPMDAAKKAGGKTSFKALEGGRLWTESKGANHLPS